MAREQKKVPRGKPAAKTLKKMTKPLVTEILREAGPEASREQIIEAADRLFGELRDMVGEMLPVNTPLNPSLAAVLDEIRPEECGFSLEEGTRRLETRLISAALATTGGDIVRAAEILGLNETNVRYRMDKYGMTYPGDVKGQPDIEGVSHSKASAALQKKFIRAALIEADGDRTKAATMLGIKPKNLPNFIKDYGLRHL